MLKHDIKEYGKKPFHKKRGLSHVESETKNSVMTLLCRT